MKNYVLLVLCFLVSCLFLSACNIKQENSPIKYQRRLEQYLPQDNPKPAGGRVDLSEGPKLRYDAKFGPKDLNFDIKIVNPY